MAKIYGELEVAQFENVSSDPSTALVSGRCIFNTTTKKAKVYDSVRWVELGGGGQGGINYIDNYAAETNLDGWDDIDYGSVDDPDDSFTATASNFVMTRLTSGQLRDDASFRISKGAADAQGEAQYYAFTLDKADLASLMEISFDMVTSDNCTDGTFAMFLQHSDDGFTTSTNIPIISESGDESVMVKANGKYRGWCQTHHTNTAYRLVIICRDSSTDTWTLDIDNIQVGPANSSNEERIVVLRAHLNSNYSAPNGATNTVPLDDVNIDTVNGFNTSTGKYTVQESGIYFLSNHARIENCSANMYLYLRKNTTDLSQAAVYPASSFETINNTWVGWLDKGDIIETRVYNGFTSNRLVYGDSDGVNTSMEIIKISNFTGDSSGQVNVMTASSHDGVSLSTGTLYYLGGMTLEEDTLGAFTSGSTSTTRANADKWVCPESGYYKCTAQVEGNFYMTDGEYLQFGFAIDGTIEQKTELECHRPGNYNHMFPNLVSRPTWINKGQEVNITVVHNGNAAALATGANDNFWSMEKVQGPAVIGPEEKINSKHELTSPSSNSGPQADLVWGTEHWDTHGMMNLSNGDVTIKSSGKYKFKGWVKLYANSGQVAAGGYLYVSMHKNGTMVDSSFIGYNNNTTYGYHNVNFEFMHELSKDDVIDFKIQGNIAGTITIGDPATPNEDGILMIEKM